MRNLRILHLGGLDLHDGNSDSRRLWLEGFLPLVSEIDHVVICGPLVRDGNFDLLVSFLEPIAARVESRDSIVLVPGRQDLNAGFAAFHFGYFGALSTCPSATNIDARRYHDLTVVGTLFDESLKRNTAKNILKIVKMLSEKVTQWHAASDRRELRVVAMAANPLQTSSYFHISEELHFLQQNVDLILCGETGIPLIPVQPYSQMPAVVGISGSDVAQLSWNLISLRLPPDLQHPQKARVQFQVRMYEGFVALEHPSFEYSTVGFATSAAQIDSVLLCKERLLPRLEAAWKAGKAALIEVCGYGDVWKDVITVGLRAHGRIAGTELLIETFRLTKYPDGTTPRSWRTEDIEIIQQIAEWHRNVHSNGATPVALVIDEALIPSSGLDRNRLDEMKKRLVEAFAPEYLRIIYLSSSYGVTLLQEQRMERIQLDPIHQTTLRDFLKRVCCELPIRNSDIEQLTGGYVGFIKLLIDELRDHYQQVHVNGSPETWRFGSAVIYTCRQSEELRKETAVFFEALQTLISRGQAVAEALLNAMSAKLEDTEDELEKLLVGEVSLAEDFAKTKGLDVALEQLKDLGIVSYRQHPNRYVLKERIPFLVQFARPLGTQVVFLSYAEPDRAQMNALKERLGQSNIGQWEWRDAKDAKQGLPAAINARLRSCDLVVVLWTKSSIKSELVISEARDAMRVPGQIKLINWFEGVMPASLTRTVNPESHDDRHENGVVTSQILTEFADAMGRNSLDEIVSLIKDNLLPLPRHSSHPKEAR